MGQHEKSFESLGHLSSEENGNAQAATHPTSRAVEEHEMEEVPEVMISLHDDEVPTVVTKAPDKLPPRMIFGKYKSPVPLSKWDPDWKPRNKLPKEYLVQSDEAAVKAICGKLKIEPKVFEALPRGASGRVVKSEELFEVLRATLVAGGTLSEFSDAVNLPRDTVSRWMQSEPEWADELEEAKRQGADALVERALYLSETPKLVEAVTESFDEEGNLKCRYVRREDAINARKLAVTTLLEVAKKWAPDKYGDKLEVKTNDSLAAKIIAAKRRSSREGAEDIEVR